MEVIVLFSSVSGDMATKSRLDSVLQLFSAKGITAVEVDAAVSENRDRRETLFKLSGVRGVFPQVFLRTLANDSHRYISVQEVGTFILCTQLYSWLNLLLVTAHGC